MDPILVSNIISWLTLMPLWAIVHHYRSTTGKFHNSIAVGYALIAMTFILNSISRILDPTYQSVIWGGSATKLAFAATLVLLLLRIRHNRKKTQ